MELATTGVDQAGQPIRLPLTVKPSRSQDELGAEHMLVNIGPQHPALARLAFGIGPDEPPAADPEVEAIAVDLLHVRQRQRQPAHVVGISHKDQART